MKLLKLAEPPSPSDLPKPGGQAVVLIHGMMSGRRSMRMIAEELIAAKFHVTNWGYATLTRSIRRHADDLGRVLRDHLADPRFDHLHLVGHSMGCIIVRQTLQSVAMPVGSRVVMLAPPNAGSRLTRIPAGPLASWFPPIAELSEAQDSLVNRLPPPVGIEVGVIAADRDRIVELSSTHLATQQDHVVVSATHQRLPLVPQAVRQVCEFLKAGCCYREDVLRRR